MIHRRRRRRRPSVAPERGQPLIDGFFKRIRMEETAREFFAMRAFEACLGARLATKARAEKLRGATLYVRVISAAWSQELFALKAQLLAKLHEATGGDVVADLRFSVGAIESLPTFVAEAAEEPAFVPVAHGAPSSAVEDAFSHIADDELRRELKHLYQRLGESLDGATARREAPR